MGYKLAFTVYDTGKPADCHHFNVTETWNTSSFNSLEEAICYAKAWLGDCFSDMLHPPRYLSWKGEKVFYHGSSFIEIVETP